jgi:hypothetical protein
VPAHERLRQADLRDQLGDRGRPGRQAADDPESVDVGEGLVDEPQLPELVRLEDGVGERAANAGGRRRQRGLSEAGIRVASTTVYINRR